MSASNECSPSIADGGKRRATLRGDFVAYTQIGKRATINAFGVVLAISCDDYDQIWWKVYWSDLGEIDTLMDAVMRRKITPLPDDQKDVVLLAYPQLTEALRRSIDE